MNPRKHGTLTLAPAPWNFLPLIFLVLLFQEMLLLLPSSSSQHARPPSANLKEAEQVMGALLGIHTSPSCKQTP